MSMESAQILPTMHTSGGVQEAIALATRALSNGSDAPECLRNRYAGTSVVRSRASSLESICDELGGSETECFASYALSSGEFDPHIATIWPFENTREFLGNRGCNGRSMDHCSKLQLLGEHINSAIFDAFNLNSINDSGMHQFDYTVDMAHAICSSISAEAELRDSRLLVLEVTSKSSKQSLVGFVIIVPAKAGFNPMQNRFLKEEAA